MSRWKRVHCTIRKSNGLAESAVKDVKDAVRTNFGLSRQKFLDKSFQEDTLS